MYADEDSIRDGEFIRARVSVIDAKVEHLSTHPYPGYSNLESLCGRGTPWSVPKTSPRRLPLCRRCAQKRTKADS